MSLRIHSLTRHEPPTRTVRSGSQSPAEDAGAAGFSSLVKQEIAAQAPNSPPKQVAVSPAGVDYPQGTPNEVLTAQDRVDQGHGVWYNCQTRLYESFDGQIVGESPYSVLQYTDPEFYRSPDAMGPILAGDQYYWERQPEAIQRLRPSVMPEMSERARIASELIKQGYEIDWSIHVLGQSPAATMWQRERFQGQVLSDVFGEPVRLPIMEIPKDLEFPGVVRKPERG